MSKKRRRKKSRNKSDAVSIPPAAKGRWGTSREVNHRPVRFVDRKKQSNKRACRGPVGEG